MSNPPSLALPDSPETPFSLEELTELCNATGEVGAVSDSLRAKLVQMWNEQSRRRLSGSSRGEE